jgi:hypothetical protein
VKKILYIFLFAPLLLSAQQNLPLNREWGLGFESSKALIPPSSPQETTVTDNLVLVYPPDLSCFKPYMVAPAPPERGKSRWSLVRKLKQESLLNVRDTADKFYLRIDPLFNFEYGKDLADTSGETLYKNTRGFIVRGSVGSKFAFESSFYENQSTFPQYMDTYIASTDDLFPQTNNYNYNVVPGQGRSKAFKKNGYDYAMSSGYISYSPNKIFNLQIGHGKHFVGDGYRSLLLSDNSYNYPYARITTTWRNIQYTNLYTSFMNLTNGGAKSPPGVERLFQKKTGSFQMLSLNLWKRIQIGLFQGMIWQAADTMNSQHLSFNTFNPVIGVNTGIYGLNDQNNVLLGGTLKLKVTKSIQLYGQYMLDDAVKKEGLQLRRKSGYQLGFKCYNLFTLKNLHLQFEYNSVRPYAYASDEASQSYTHYNQPLAHPLGANFTEMVGIINYRLSEFFIEVKLNYAQKGRDTLDYNYGGNVFASSNSFPIQQDLSEIKQLGGSKTTILYEDLHVGYLVNPSTNFNVVLGLSNRSETAGKETRNTQFVYFGIRTSLANFYYDL